MHEIVYAGKNLSEFGAFIDSASSWTKPAKKVTKIAIPGRDGDLLIDEGSYANVTVPFRIIIPKNFTTNYTNLMSWISAVSGYAALEYTGDPMVYRMARIQTDVDPTTQAFLRHGSFTLSFDCKPQRWLKQGDIWVPVTASTTLNNPTSQTALPIIRIYGTGYIMIGSKKITVSTAGTSYIDFDCETMNAYEGSTNRNSNISIDFTSLGLVPGNNGITLSGVTADIKPRWWEV